MYCTLLSGTVGPLSTYLIHFHRFHPSLLIHCTYYNNPQIILAAPLLTPRPGVHISLVPPRYPPGGPLYEILLLWSKHHHLHSLTMYANNISHNSPPPPPAPPPKPSASSSISTTPQEPSLTFHAARRSLLRDHRCLLSSPSGLLSRPPSLPKFRRPPLHSAPTPRTRVTAGSQTSCCRNRP